jgi:hypothetical protein
MSRNLFIGTALLAFALFLLPGAGYSAKAPAPVIVPGLQLAGDFLIATYGESTDANNNEGHLDLAGEVSFGRRGLVSSVNITITYDTRDDGDDEICQLTDPSDVTYQIGKNGVGTLTVSVASDDNCTNPDSSSQTVVVTPPSAITFRAFLNPYSLRGGIISTASTFQDSNGDTVSVVNAEGTLDPAQD